MECRETLSGTILDQNEVVLKVWMAGSTGNKQ